MVHVIYNMNHVLHVRRHGGRSVERMKCSEKQRGERCRAEKYDILSARPFEIYYFYFINEYANGRVSISPELVSVRRYRVADFVAGERNPRVFRAHGSYRRRTAYAAIGVPGAAAAA